ncbi:MAG: biopolymer transport protein ExbD [Bradymonadia bacterium]|jgi:biopolymer transport protein ExbD
MAAGFDHDDDDVIADINMVPFIDISLVLLIIFMVTSSYIARQAIEVELPTAASGSEVSSSTIAIVVERTGQVYFNGAPTTPQDLPALVRAEVAIDENVQAIVAGDRGVDYGAVIDIVDIIKLNGVRTFALNIERETEN